MGGKFHPKLNIAPRPIANKYCEGKVKRTLRRGLKVPEIARAEANESSPPWRDCSLRTGAMLWRVQAAAVLAKGLWGASLAAQTSSSWAAGRTAAGLGVPLAGRHQWLGPVAWLRSATVLRAVIPWGRL